MTTPSIMSVFQFTPHDLATNRAGYATPKQTYQKTQTTIIQIMLIVFLGTWAAFGAIMKVVLLFVYELTDHELQLRLSDLSGLLFSTFIFIIAPTWAAIYLIRRILQKWHDRRTLIIRRSSGPITLLKHDIIGTYYLDVDNQRLRITNLEYRALMPYLHTVWHVYYFPRSKIVASIEPH